MRVEYVVTMGISQKLAAALMRRAFLFLRVFIFDRVIIVTSTVFVALFLLGFHFLWAFCE